MEICRDAANVYVMIYIQKAFAFAASQGKKSRAHNTENLNHDETLQSQGFNVVVYTVQRLQRLYRWRL
ncbi:MAG: hypothetical protein IT279_03640 [Ignavibacteriaceae bacterium]|nr:hypothetical protein [Ignavibacteriaceae bacterium]